MRLSHLVVTKTTSTALRSRTGSRSHARGKVTEAIYGLLCEVRVTLVVGDFHPITMAEGMSSKVLAVRRPTHSNEEVRLEELQVMNVDRFGGELLH